MSKIKELIDEAVLVLSNERSTIKLKHDTAKGLLNNDAVEPYIALQNRLRAILSHRRHGIIKAIALELEDFISDGDNADLNISLKAEALSQQVASLFSESPISDEKLSQDELKIITSFIENSESIIGVLERHKSLYFDEE